jgi:ABC-type Fe3+-hydroxamate transport system substrate-binding protein
LFIYCHNLTTKIFNTFKGVEKIGENDVEKVAKTKPDLIVVYSTDKNIKIFSTPLNLSLSNLLLSTCSFTATILPPRYLIPPA